MDHIFNFSHLELCEFIATKGLKKYCADQIYQWVYEKNEINPHNWNNLKKDNRELINNSLSFELPKIVEENKSENGKVNKLLLELIDGELIEIVIMSYLDKIKSKKRVTLCISSQVGCSIGCPFCATGMEGFVRDLTSEEIISEFFVANTYTIKHLNHEITNVVFMGMGEPFLNFNNVVYSINAINKRFLIGERKIFVSTSGIVDKIKEFANMDRDFGLAISLHAGFDEKRDELVPINKKYPIKSLIDSIDYYIKLTRRRVTIEYALIEGENTGLTNGEELGKLFKNKLVHFNLIPLNKVENSKYDRSNEKNIKDFLLGLDKYKITYSIREEMGMDLSGACGQLKRKRGNSWKV